MNGSVFYGVEWVGPKLKGVVWQKKGGQWRCLRPFKRTWPSPPLAQSVYVSVPRSQAFLATVTVPSLEADTLKQQANQAFPCFLNDLVWGSHLLHTEKQQHTLLLFALPKERVERYRAQVAAAGLRLRGLGLDCLGQIRLWQQTKGRLRPEDEVLIIRKKGKTSEWTFLKGGRFLLCRMVFENQNRREAFAEAVRFLKKQGGGKIKRIIRSHRIGFVGEESAFFPDPRPSSSSPAASSKKQTLVASLALFLMVFSLILKNQTDRAADQLNQMNQQIRRLDRPSQGLGEPPQKKGAALSLLQEVSQHVPRRVHLLDLRFDKERGHLSCKGRASTYKAMSTFVSKLAESQRIQNVFGEKAQLIQWGARTLVEFSFEATVL